MFKGDLVILRAYSKKDIEKAHLYFNDLPAQYLLNPNAIFPISLQEEEKFVESIINNQNKDREYHFAIETLRGEYIGGCSYFHGNHKNGICYLGIAIPHAEHQGKGYGTDAMKILCNYLFYEMNLRKILLQVFAYNTRAISCYEKLGFKSEGLLKQHVYRNGEYHDELIMALFRDEFKFKKNFVEL